MFASITTLPKSPLIAFALLPALSLIVPVYELTLRSELSVSTATTAVGRVVSYDSNTGVLKFWQYRTMAGFNTVGTAQTNPTYGYELQEFTSSPGTGGNLTIVPTSGSNLAIDTSFTGLSTVINSRTYYLGQEFTNGIANPEVKKYSGNIVYVDNRPSITRSTNQKEDIKVILQF